VPKQNPEITLNSHFISTMCVYAKMGSHTEGGVLQMKIFPSN